jgi:hypothetical protein
MTTTTEQAVLAAVARATTARLGGATTRFFDDLATAARLGSRTRGLFDRTATRRLNCTTAARFFSAATALVAAAEKFSAGAGLAFHHHGRTQQGHHTNGGSHHKVLTHRKSSKKTRNKSCSEADHGLPAAHVTKSVLVTAAAYRDQLSRSIKKQRSQEDG